VLLPLPVEAGAFHTLTLALDPPCPRIDNPALACRALGIAAGGFAYQPGSGAAGAFGRGVALAASAPETVRAGETLPIWLSWGFSQAIAENDIRFVHLLDADGALQAQMDTTLGARAVGTGWAEQVDLPLRADLPPGTYSLYVGWYSYPDLIRFPVLTDSPRMADGLLLVGEVQVE
jgi:methionine-rich copper-binding protein CopC